MPKPARARRRPSPSSPRPQPPPSRFDNHRPRSSTARRPSHIYNSQWRPASIAFHASSVVLAISGAPIAPTGISTFDRSQFNITLASRSKCHFTDCKSTSPRQPKSQRWLFSGHNLCIFLRYRPVAGLQGRHRAYQILEHTAFD